MGDKRGLSVLVDPVTVPKGLCAGRTPGRRLRCEHVADAPLQPAHLAGSEDGLDPTDVVVDAHDAVAVGVQLGDPGSVQLGGQLEPTDLASLQALLLDGPDVLDAPVPDPLPQSLVLGSTVAVRRRDAPVSEDLDRLPRPRLRGVRPPPLLLDVDAFVTAVGTRRQAAVQSYVAHQTTVPCRCYLK